jgi:hypothetical protein
MGRPARWTIAWLAGGPWLGRSLRARQGTDLGGVSEGGGEDALTGRGHSAHSRHRLDPRLVGPSHQSALAEESNEVVERPAVLAAVDAPLWPGGRPSFPCCAARGTAGRTTPADSRSQRNRASRCGGQLLTRARGPPCNNGLRCWLWTVGSRPVRRLRRSLAAMGVHSRLDVS